MQERAAAPGGSWIGSLAAPAILVAAAVGVLGGIAWLSQRVGHETTRPDASAFSNPLPAPGANRYIVKQTAQGSVSLVAEASKDPANAPVQQLTLAPSLRVEVLRAAGPADLKPGDWLAVVGVSNAVRNFSIHALVAIPGATPGSAQLARSAAGFAGNEAAPAADDQVILGGVIEQVTADSVTLKGSPVPVRIDVSPRAPIFRLGPGTTADIHDGDLLAFGGAGPADPRAAVLVRPASTR